MSSPSVHKLGSRAKILLSSVFGPYAQDDEFGSRTINPMELHHNQVTRVQGGFSLRMFHRSFGLLMIQANLEAPCTLLDFPSRERFVHEIENNSYDIVGISSIVVNIGKVKEMCSLIRQHQPRATIVIGGHIANKENLSEIVDADHIVKGEGIRWFRKFLGEDEEAPVRHPMVLSGFGSRIMGMPLAEKPGETAAILIPSVGCPVGCNFCSTSAMFGGKGKFVNFYETGDALFSVMSKIEEGLKTQSFFVLDENFLLHRERALRLLELMEQNNKSWALHVFSSARVLQSYTMEQLVRLGLTWVWMGLEGENSQYAKLNNVDTRALVKNLQAHGIRVLGSTIVGLEDHTPENLDLAIDYAVSHNTDFHQFMLYTAVPGTPLFEQHRQAGTLLDESEFPLADMHGQYRFNHRHPHIDSGQEEQFLVKAFERDFEINGPSLGRMIETTLNGWQKYKNHPNRGIRERFVREKNTLRTSYAAAIWAMSKWYRGNEQVSPRLKALLKRLIREFGWTTRLAAPLAGRYIYRKLKKEEERLARGWTYEPTSFYEKNAAALALDRPHKAQSQPAVLSVRGVTGELSPVSAR